MTGPEPVKVPIVPGEVIPAGGSIELNAGAQRTTLEVLNTGGNHHGIPHPPANPPPPHPPDPTTAAPRRRRPWAPAAAVDLPLLVR